MAWLSKTARTLSCGNLELKDGVTLNSENRALQTLTVEQLVLGFAEMIDDEVGALAAMTHSPLKSAVFPGRRYG